MNAALHMVIEIDPLIFVDLPRTIREKILDPWIESNR